MDKEIINMVTIAMMLNLLIGMSITVYTQGSFDNIINDIDDFTSNNKERTEDFHNSDNLFISNSGSLLSYIEGFINLFFFVGYFIRLFFENLIIAPISFTLFSTNIVEQVGFSFVTLFILITNINLIYTVYKEVVRK